VTIVFTDIVDSSVLTARLGDHAWLEVIRTHNNVIREITEAHNGTVVETQGDGSMLAFSSARRAVACAKAIQAGIGAAFADASPPIRIRIGVHTGDALHEADHFFGTTVNYAARVASQGLGDEVLVSQLVHDLLAGSGVDFVESRDVELKGLDGSRRGRARPRPEQSAPWLLDRIVPGRARAAARAVSDRVGRDRRRQGRRRA
jgi:class 3 adenylate cyclase